MSIISVKAASKAVTIAASVLCLGGVISFVRADETQKPIALNVIIGASAIAFSSHVSAQLCEESAKYQAGKLVEKHEIQVKGVEKERDTFNEKYRKQTNVVTEVKAINAKKEQENFVLGEELKIKNALIVALQKQLEEIKSTISQRYAEIDEKLAQEDKRYELAIYQLKTSFQESLKYKIDTSYEKLADTIAYKLSDAKCEGIFPQLEKLYATLKQMHPKHYQLLNEIAYVEGEGNEVVEAITDIYFQISDEIAALKVKYRNTLNIDERVALEAAMDELIERRDLKKFIPKPKVDKALDYYQQSQNEQLQNIKEIARENSQGLQELKDEVYELISQIEAKNMEIAQLKQKVAKLSEPYQFFGKGTLAEIGNLVISHYYTNYGYVFDALTWEESDTGYKLIFGTRRNPALTEEQVYQNNSQIQLAAITNSLHGTLPKFDFNRQNSTATLDVTLKKTTKKESVKDDIDKLWVPASKFEKFVSKWERVRITAGSTGGKSPTAKNLALAIMNVRKGKGEIRLYDPQHGSKKDFWNMPKAGTSHEDNIEGMKELCELLDARSEIKGKSHKFILYVFDEIDSTIAKHRGDASFKDLVVYSLSQGSHQDLGAIYIGQSADANTIPGMTHSQWNNATQLHIGSNASVWIDKSTTVTNEDKTKLLTQYKKISEYCERMNEELGLDIYTDAGAYRFALAVPLSGLPKFIQLPSFDSYEYNEVMTSDNQTPQPIERTVASTTVSETKCPQCGNEDLRKNGKHNGRQKYICKSCGEHFKI
ncbi:MAG: hypothetical protein KME64_03940 [Scytonematopsis contorta HA4267-MV1]|jgi:predicted RNA-binding Zn-ribbon protein involved in translation (DUF1610 family)/multisubunit Na+/H+ antiporter MnhG subunit|nr:hypothetical protein [Scytonematopsis contorta HA4267-MV1]